MYLHFANFHKSTVVSKSALNIGELVEWWLCDDEIPNYHQLRCPACGSESAILQLILALQEVGLEKTIGPHVG